MLHKLYIIILSLLFTHTLHAKDPMMDNQENTSKTEDAIFAMGCFWCGESEFRDHTTGKPLPGITSLRVGYAGGEHPNPTYENHEGYKEAVKITFDPTIISYEKLLTLFWHNVDPLNNKGQFCDEGPQYTSAIFFKNDDQKAKALATKEVAHTTLGKEILTDIIAYSTFYDAEEYHQDYKAKNPVRYKYYRWNCGRDARLKTLWDNK